MVHTPFTWKHPGAAVRVKITNRRALSLAPETNSREKVGKFAIFPNHYIQHGTATRTLIKKRHSQNMDLNAIDTGSKESLHNKVYWRRNSGLYFHYTTIAQEYNYHVCQYNTSDIQINGHSTLIFQCSIRSNKRD